MTLCENQHNDLDKMNLHQDLPSKRRKTDSESNTSELVEKESEENANASSEKNHPQLKQEKELNQTKDAPSKTAATQNTMEKLQVSEEILCSSSNQKIANEMGDKKSDSKNGEKKQEGGGAGEEEEEEEEIVQSTSDEVIKNNKRNMEVKETRTGAIVAEDENNSTDECGVSSNFGSANKNNDNNSRSVDSNDKSENKIIKNTSDDDPKLLKKNSDNNNNKQNNNSNNQSNNTNNNNQSNSNTNNNQNHQNNNDQNNNNNNQNNQNNNNNSQNNNNQFVHAIRCGNCGSDNVNSNADNRGLIACATSVGFSALPTASGQAPRVEPAGVQMFVATTSRHASQIAIPIADISAFSQAGESGHCYVQSRPSFDTVRFTTDNANALVGQQVHIKRENSPILTIIPQNSLSRSFQNHPNSESVIPTVSIGGHLVCPIQSPVRDTAIMFHVKSDVQIPFVAQNSGQNHIVYGSSARINGVKPEVISGCMPNLRPPASSAGITSAANTHVSMQAPSRAVPTVIMGESCGVRTMVWSYEPSSSPQTTSAPLHSQPSPALASFQNKPSSVSSNNEEAAHLLLSLGQNRSTNIRSHTQTNDRIEQPLNMERLWAGDYSQLPEGQQMHTINLAAQAQFGVPIDNLKTDPDPPVDDDEQPLVCMICEDKATGLHYGIITCEG